jgi:DNA-directed RNA polymerase beta subunit
MPTPTPQATLRTSLTQKGDDYVSVGLEGILSSTEKVIGVSRCEVDPDDRDSYEFKTFLRPAELFKDRINLDNGKLLLGAMRKASRSKTLSSWTPGFMDSYMRGMLIGHPLATALEETNPMAIVAQLRRITGFGPGGINSTDAITPSMQNVHASQFGFVTPVDGPESEMAGVDKRMAYGAKWGNDGKLYQKLRDTKTGKLRWVDHATAARSVVKFPD